MVVSFERSIWPDVSQHAWKYRQRSRKINGIIWHTTRGGQWYAEPTELSAALNWFRSPNNRIRSPYGDYAGISNYVIGNGECVEVVPGENLLGAWSSWPSDEHVLSVEVTQSNLGQPISQQTILRCVRFAIEAAKTYGFPLERVVNITDDWAWTGMAGHADTVQGRSQGKTDPDDQFWTPFLKALKEETAMTDALSKKIEALEARVARLERIVLTNGGLAVRATGENLHVLRKAGVPDPVVGQEYRLTGETLLAYLDLMEMNLYLGHQHLQKDVFDIKKKLGL